MPTDSNIPRSPSKDKYLQHDQALGPLVGDDPFTLFGEWFADAKQYEPNDPNAMCLATVDADGMPDARMVLLKGYDASGFTFYTNLQSAKGQQLQYAQKAALVFHWKSIRRQVRIRGQVEMVPAEEADTYFKTRARDSQIGAWASDQSQPLAGRGQLQNRVKEFEDKFQGQDVPRPPHWSGYRLVPLQIEFWRDRAFRLHDRLTFTRKVGDVDWQTQSLFP